MLQKTGDRDTRCGPAPVTEETAGSSPATSISLAENDPVASDGFVCDCSCHIVPSFLLPSSFIHSFHSLIHKQLLIVCFYTTNGLVRKTDNEEVNK